MALFPLFAVLLIEKIRPSPYCEAVLEPSSWLAGTLEGFLHASSRSHGMIVGVIAVGGLFLAAGMLHALSPLLAWLWNVTMRYLTLGFRHFSQYYKDIGFAPRIDDLPHAREWRGRPTDGLSSSEIAILRGTCGAVRRRAAASFADVRGKRTDAEAGYFGNFSQQAFAVID